MSIMRIGGISVADREKVIRGLECCIDPEVPCRECPYYNYGHCDPDDVRRNALSLLNEQEARVMDDALLLEYDDAVWIENKRDTGTVLSICKSADDRQFRFFSKNEWENVAYLRENYGKTWRCWTSRPTEEQRKEAAWDD